MNNILNRTPASFFQNFERETANQVSLALLMMHDSRWQLDISFVAVGATTGGNIISVAV